MWYINLLFLVCKVYRLMSYLNEVIGLVFLVVIVLLFSGFVVIYLIFLSSLGFGFEMCMKIIVNF